jgi:tetratricopeptide (TPR) repeat protein
MLVLLDNARDAAQVRPLMPGSCGCLVLITSRDPLAELVASEGAHRLALDLMADQDARELLAARLGARRAAGQNDAVAELAGLCARLPLALSIAAARAATGPGLTLASITAQLRQEHSRLDALVLPGSPDPSGSVRSVFEWSYRNLSAAAARMFRLLGLQPGPEISWQAAASMAAMPPMQARRALGELATAQLLAEQSPGRFAFHDLVRLYAAEQAAAESEAGRRAALRRLLDYYLHTAHTAGLLLYRPDDPLLLPAPAPGAMPGCYASRDEALAWFLAEQRSVVIAARAAADHGFDTRAWQIPAAMRDFAARQGQWDDWIATQRIALTAAQRLGDRSAQARAYRSIGDACISLRQFQDADVHLQHALGLSRILGDRVSAAACLLSLARVSEEQGDYRNGLSCAEQALGLYRDTGNEAGQACALNTVGWFHAHLGGHRSAVRHCQSALSTYRKLGSHFGQAVTLDSLGYTRQRSGRPAEAAALYRQAVTLYRQVGDRYFQAMTILHLGDACHAAGDAAAGRQSWDEALAILNDLHHPDASQIYARLQNPGAYSRLADDEAAPRAGSRS